MKSLEDILKYFNRHPSEWKVLRMLYLGLSVKMIAGKLHKSVSTIRHQVEHIHKILDSHNPTETIRRGLECGLLP